MSQLQPGSVPGFETPRARASGNPPATTNPLDFGAQAGGAGAQLRALVQLERDGTPETILRQFTAIASYLGANDQGVRDIAVDTLAKAVPFFQPAHWQHLFSGKVVTQWQESMRLMEAAVQLDPEGCYGYAPALFMLRQCRVGDVSHRANRALDLLLPIDRLDEPALSQPVDSPSVEDISWWSVSIAAEQVAGAYEKLATEPSRPTDAIIEKALWRPVPAENFRIPLKVLSAAISEAFSEIGAGRVDTIIDDYLQGD